MVANALCEVQEDLEQFADNLPLATDLLDTLPPPIDMLDTWVEAAIPSAATARRPGASPVPHPSPFPSSGAR